MSNDIDAENAQLRARLAILNNLSSTEAQIIEAANGPDWDRKMEELRARLIVVNHGVDRMPPRT
jgi:hypothetical protein